MASPDLCGGCQSCLAVIGHNVIYSGNLQGAGASVGSPVDKAGFDVDGFMAWVPRYSVHLLGTGTNSLHS